MKLFLPLLQVWELGILLRALRPEEGTKKAMPSGKTGWGCYPQNLPFRSALFLVTVSFWKSGDAASQGRLLNGFLVCFTHFGTRLGMGGWVCVGQADWLEKGL